MLTKEQIDKALAMENFDIFYDEVGEMNVHIAHTKEGAFFIVMDGPSGPVLKDMSFFIPYLWLAAANAKVWPRSKKVGIHYFTQMCLHKTGDMYYTTPVSTLAKTINEVGDFLFPARSVRKGRK